MERRSFYLLLNRTKIVLEIVVEREVPLLLAHFFSNGHYRKQTLQKVKKFCKLH